MPMLITAVVVALLCIVVIAAVTWRFVSQARLARRFGVAVGPSELVAMSLRGVDAAPLIEAAGLLRAAGIEIPNIIAKLETQAIAGGNPQRVCEALITADRAKLEMTYFVASALDLDGVDPLRGLEAMTLARRSRWPLTCSEVLRIAEAGHDPVEYVRQELRLGAGV